MRNGIGLTLGGSGGARRAPTFSDITGLFLHYSTSFGTTDATKWSPRSGTGDCTQPTAGQRPIITASAINGRPGYRLTAAGVKNWILPALASLTAAHAFLVVYKDADPGNGGAWWETGDAGASSSATPFTDGTIYDNFGTTVRKTVGNPATALNAPHIYEVITASGEWTAKLNGTQLFTTGTNTVGWDAAPTLGSAATSTDAYLGDFVLFNAKLSAGNATIARDRLKAWFGTP
jgi:hypothetical protein